ncbi:MAG: 30S ribosomal protein S15 [Fidelibacterota bacterium]
MSITKEKKTQIIEEFGDNPGKTETQVALLTVRIKNLTEHFKINPKDHASKRGLLVLVNRRKKLLKYLKRRNEQAYKDLIAKLGLRK